MINTVTITNHLGESVVLDLRNPEQSGFLVRPPISGLGPSKADINTTPMVTGDGSVYNSKHVGERNIVFQLGLNENPTVVASRHNTYKYFPVGKRIDILIQSDGRTCRTYGYVESNEPDIFSKEETTVISVICPESYFYATDVNVTVFSGTEPTFEFPFSNESLVSKLISFGDVVVDTEKSVIYDGDASTGILIYIHILGTVTNLKIMNFDTREVMLISDAKLSALLNTPGAGLIAGDDIVISTIKGSKSITLSRAGEDINILGALEKGYSWFQIDKGDNLFAYTADNGVSNVQFRVVNPIIYAGI